MPTFGKRNSLPAGTYVFHNSRGKMRHEKTSMHWKVENSRLRDVDRRLGRNLIQTIAELEPKQGRPPVVAEWGCGMGNALFEPQLHTS